MKLQIFRDAWTIFKTRESDGFIERVLRHLPVGRPLPSDNRDQTAIRNKDLVIPGNRLRRGAVLAGRADQWTLTRKHSEDVFFLWITGQIPGGIAQNKTYLLLQSTRLQIGMIHRRVSGSHQHLAMPRDHKENASIVRVGNHDCRITL